MDMEILKLNSQLQQKKNLIRKELAEKGILKREGKNDHSGYKYFSESQYKKLFTELLAKHNVEIKCSEVDYEMFETKTSKGNIVFGRHVKLEYQLIDVETGYAESSIVSGESMDYSDKAGYQAYTGALKYFFANTFMVATGDEVETKTIEPNASVEDKKATPAQIKVLEKVYKDDLLDQLLAKNEIDKLEDLPMTKASELIKKLKEMEKENV